MCHVCVCVCVCLFTFLCVCVCSILIYADYVQGISKASQGRAELGRAEQG